MANPRLSRGSKYKNIPHVIDGISFASKKEAQRYADLKLLEKAGKISQLYCQYDFPLHVCGTLVCTLRADFTYFENGSPVVEDVKAKSKNGKTPDTCAYRLFRLKAKLFKAIYGREIVEI
jgi:Protein of unknown function (DUF1064)